MNRYLKAYQAQTGKPAPENADRLTPVFDQMMNGATLPPRGQQAVNAGFTAHTLNDPRVQPAVYDYYQWVTTVYLADANWQELSAKLIGMAFTSNQVFKTDLPQPLTLNPWQVSRMATYPLKTKRAVMVENNGVFIWLAYLHPDWPLINQSGNDLNPAAGQLLRSLEQRGVQLTYLGDLDSAGIQIAARLFRQLPQTSIETFTAIQTPGNVSLWQSIYGKADARRTREVTVTPEVLNKEAQTIQTQGCFVEQEQLIEVYERLIPAWLAAEA